MMKPPRSETLPRRRFDVAEVARMAEAGVFHSDERLELLDGELIPVPLPGAKHSGRVDRLVDLLRSNLGRSAVLRVQSPLVVDLHNLFVPDLAILQRRADYYENGYPNAADALLVIEVAESSTWRDRKLKLPRYAAAGVPRAWILDLTRGTLSEFTDPGSSGYSGERDCVGGDRLQVVAGCEVDVSELLGIRPIT